MSDFMKSLSRIAIPVTLQSMLQASFSIIDQIMIGQLGEVNIAAVGLYGNFSLGFFRGDRLSRHCCRDPDRPVHRRRQRA